MDDSGSNYSVTADTAKTAGTLTVTEEPLYFVEKLQVSMVFRWVHPSLYKGVSVRRSVGLSVRRMDGPSDGNPFFFLIIEIIGADQL